MKDTRISSTKAIALCGIMTTIALMLSYIEAIIPFNFGVPGIKLGLANLVVMVALCNISAKHAFVIDLVRILLAGLLFNGLFGTLYSLAGGMLSIVVMILLYKSKAFSVVGVSLAGGVAHNLGQLLVACVLVNNSNMFLYFPVLLFSGLITGIMIGIATYYVNKSAPKNLF
ncbi:MAG: Gx transporter family protein [Clostridia bacterium]|nr:Gx transporter family protein [Clostridia bacterium]